jgi:hypothetical protein
MGGLCSNDGFSPTICFLRRVCTAGSWVFYDVDAAERVVHVRAVRYKGNLTTKEIV